MPLILSQRQKNTHKCSNQRAKCSEKKQRNENTFVRFYRSAKKVHLIFISATQRPTMDAARIEGHTLYK